MKITNIFMFLLLVLISCHNPAKTNKNTSVKYLHVSVDIPDNLLIEVRTNFRSIPTWWGCKCLSEQDWNWVPLENSEIQYISQKSKELTVPLFVKKSTICRWKFTSAEIGVSLKKNNFGITGFCIYPKRDTTLNIEYDKLIDTMQYICSKHLDQFSDLNDTIYRCIRLSPNETDHFYTFDGINQDTAHVTVIVHNDTGPIMYMDTTMEGDFKFRAFGKNEKIPGLKEKKK